MDFPAVTVCNQNRVHCGHLKQLIAEEMVKASHLNITEAYSLLEENGTAQLGEELDQEMAIIYSLLEDTGCRTKGDEKGNRKKEYQKKGARK